MRTSYLSYISKRVKERRIDWLVKQSMKFPLVKLGRVINRPLCGPVHGIVFVTYRCNYNCVFCGLPQRAKENLNAGLKELTTEELKGVIDDFAEIGTTGIGFTGGEPLIRSDICELIAYTRKKGLFTHLSHNGFFVAKRRAAEAILDSGLDAIDISLDGPNSQTHDWSRGTPGAFEKVVVGIKNLVSLRKKYKSEIEVKVTCVITERNFDEIVDLVYFVNDLGVDRIGFMPVQDLAVQMDSKKRPARFKVKNLKKANQVIDALIALKRKGFKDGFSIDTTVEYLKLFKDSFAGRLLPIPCFAGYATYAIDPYGNIYPCFPWVELTKPVANIKQVSLKDYWYSDAMRHVRRKTKECRACFWNNQTELNVFFNKLLPK